MPRTVRATPPPPPRPAPAPVEVTAGHPAAIAAARRLAAGRDVHLRATPTGAVLVVNGRRPRRR